MKVAIKVELLPATSKVLYSADIGGADDPTAEEMVVAHILRKHLEAAFAEIAQNVAECREYRGVAAEAKSLVGVAAAKKLHADARNEERVRMGMDIPKDKSYPADAAQCDHCGGHGCTACAGKGWVEQGSEHARHCANPKCSKIIPPDCVTVYCSDECAFADA